MWEYGLEHIFSLLGNDVICAWSVREIGVGSGILAVLPLFALTILLILHARGRMSISVYEGKSYPGLISLTCGENYVQITSVF